MTQLAAGFKECGADYTGEVRGRPLRTCHSMIHSVSQVQGAHCQEASSNDAAKPDVMVRDDNLLEQVANLSGF